MAACPYCHGEVDPRQAVPCPTCSAPHHEECFAENEGCAVSLCASGPKLPVVTGAGPAIAAAASFGPSRGRLTVELPAVGGAPRREPPVPVATLPSGHGRKRRGRGLVFGVVAGMAAIVGTITVIALGSDHTSTTPGNDTTVAVTGDAEAVAADLLTQELVGVLRARVASKTVEWTNAGQLAEDRKPASPASRAGTAGGASPTATPGTPGENTPGE